jgi:Serine acetyltransferase, N-terminal
MRFRWHCSWPATEHPFASSQRELVMLKTLRNDIWSVFDRDPAARSTLEVLLCYSGLHAVWGHRLAHWFWVHNLKLLARAGKLYLRKSLSGQRGQEETSLAQGGLSHGRKESLARD